MFLWGLPLGPLMANVFMCYIGDILEANNNIPFLYRCYVVDTLVVMESIDSATDFPRVLNDAHPCLTFTMESECEGSIPFLGMNITKDTNKLETQVYRKPTDIRLLLHFQSDVDSKYKRGLVNTMIDRTHRLSSSPKSFTSECGNRCAMFCKLPYPKNLIEPAIHKSKRKIWERPKKWRLRNAFTHLI